MRADPLGEAGVGWGIFDGAGFPSPAGGGLGWGGARRGILGLVFFGGGGLDRRERVRKAPLWFMGLEVYGFLFVICFCLFICFVFLFFCFLFLFIFTYFPS